VDSTALALVLSAALIHAGWNLAAKRVPGGGALFVWCYYTVGAVGFVPVLAVLLFTRSYDPQPTWLLAILGNALLHIAYGIVLQRGYTVGDLGVVYPLARGTGPLLSGAFAVVVLGERPGPIALLGGLLIVVGVLVIGFGRSPGQGDAPELPNRRRLGIAFGILTGAVIGGYTLWDAHSVTALGVPPVVYFGAATLLQSAFLLPMALRFRPQVARIWHDHKVEAMIIGIASPVAYLFVLFALQRAPVSLVAPAREVSIVFGGLIGWLVLREPNPARRLAGAVLVLAGIAAIAVA
jgi:drug/metabolite transporter (DMT)-like permease